MPGATSRVAVAVTYSPALTSTPKLSVREATLPLASVVTVMAPIQRSATPSAALRGSAAAAAKNSMRKLVFAVEFSDQVMSIPGPVVAALAMTG